MPKWGLPTLKGKEVSPKIAALQKTFSGRSVDAKGASPVSSGSQHSEQPSGLGQSSAGAPPLIKQGTGKLYAVQDLGAPADTEAPLEAAPKAAPEAAQGSPRVSMAREDDLSGSDEDNSTSQHEGAGSATAAEIARDALAALTMGDCGEARRLIDRGDALLQNQPDPEQQTILAQQAQHVVNGIVGDRLLAVIPEP